MKRIAIVSTGYAWFPCEPGPSRFYYIANTFVNAGWNVEVFTVDFQHFKKEVRDVEAIRNQHYPFEITFVHAPAYKKNLDLRRVYSNYVVSKNIIKTLKNCINSFDAVYCSIPSNKVAAEVSKLCKQAGVSFIVDIEDLWPEAMSMVIKNQIIRNTLLYSLLKDAEIAYSNASGVIGTSKDYTERAFQKRKKGIPSETVYVGCDLSDFDYGVEQYCSSIKKADGQFWVTYAGSISNSYDIRTLIDAGNELKNTNVHVQLLGTGSLKSELEEYASKLGADNVHFWGFTEYHKMAAALSVSDVVINSFVKGAPQSIVNKVGDYLASGKPMINTLENPVFCDLVEHYQFGVNIEPENTSALVNAIKNLQINESLRNHCGDNARLLAETDFDRHVSYKRIVSLVEMVTNGET